MKKVISIALLCLVLVLGTTAFAATVEKPQLSVYVDGEKCEFEFVPINVDGANLIGLRELAAYVGIDDENIDYQEKDGKQVITLTNDDDMVLELVIGSKTMKLDGKEVQSTVAPMIYKVNGEDKTYIPARSVAESFGYVVKYDASSDSILIRNQEDYAAALAILSSGNKEGAKFGRMSIVGTTSIGMDLMGDSTSIDIASETEVDLTKQIMIQTSVITMDEEETESVIYFDKENMYMETEEAVIAFPYQTESFGDMLAQQSMVKVTPEVVEIYAAAFNISADDKTYTIEGNIMLGDMLASVMQSAGSLGGGQDISSMIDGIFVNEMTMTIVIDKTYNMPISSEIAADITISIMGQPMELVMTSNMEYSFNKKDVLVIPAHILEAAE